MPITIDLDDLTENLTMGEVELIENVTGVPIGRVLRHDGMSGTAVMAIALVLRRRSDPTFTLDQARALPFAEVEFASPDRAEPDPTPATG